MLNWNGRRWLEACLAALLRNRGEAEVWVVDNGSTDGSRELANGCEGVRVLELGHNLGFGRAYNRALAACTAEVAILLNNDTVVADGWLEALLEEAEAHPAAAAISSKLLHLDRPNIINHAGGGVTVLGAAYDVGLGAPDGPEYDRPRTVGCASGAAMLVRREAFLAVGGFDESYFAYFEDADLCWRLWLRGYEVRYAPQARVLHAYGGSTGRGRLSPFRIQHCQTNRLQNMFKNLEARTLAWAVPASLGYDGMRIASLTRAREDSAARGYLRGSRRFVELLPHVLRERERVQGTRVRSDEELLRVGVLTGLGAASLEWRRLGKLPAAGLTVR